ncbi:hypothetical protein G6O69_18975 [Pseudenhygromyxa sp. WMMC2535]|uniref:hypothetical protein n=1 Tax=Pseudenhygromyxa sp. WMMC2535 TaxID=2712867 RepID=UPI0015516E07|nr:hypothetical protein [Pseudenhygromyxa sp. WMMC2535]NVB39935.1 hypothetical protein [Pseudenhygromyxa sp. WMMC2535]
MADDQTHWLWRLGAGEWLDAARNDLEQGRTKLGSRRAAVTLARRAAGMALNAALVEMSTRGWTRARCEDIWGRSYVDHLRMLGSDPSLAGPLGPSLAERCASLMAIPVMPPQGLVRLGLRRDDAASRALDEAAAILAACTELSSS